jgi:hypothetical protein
LYSLHLEYIYSKVVIAIKYYLFNRTKLLLAAIIIFIVIAAILALLYYKLPGIHTSKLVMGATLISQCREDEPNTAAPDKPDLEKYFRPSKLPILNNRALSQEKPIYFPPGGTADITNIKIPGEYLKSPEDSIIYYFSILREAANLIPGKFGGCGSVGSGTNPFPISYNFLTSEYQKRMSFNQYLKSFEGIGHTNLIKHRKLSPDQIHPKDMRYFVEIETIEGSDKGLTYFAYYYGFVYMQKQGNKYLISDMTLSGEDFLCAAYHGWSHDAEANVAIRYGGWCKMIKEKYPTNQKGYVKLLSFKGTDGSDYMIEFIELTNDTDVEVAQYKKGTDGLWHVVYLDPAKCVEEKRN